MTLAPSDSVTRTKSIAGRLFEERMLVITAKDSMLHRFNEVGTFIWQFIDEPKKISAICTAIARNFEGFSEEGNHAEIIEFLELLEKKGCILIHRSVDRS